MRVPISLTGAALAAALLAVPLSTAGKSREPKTRWIKNVTITEYYPAPERWFIWRKMKAPGLKGRHRVDWLYSSSGVVMEGDGQTLGGRRIHLATYGPKNWVAPDGKPTR